MEIDERRDIARLCRAHGYIDLAKYHEKKIREAEKRKKPKE